MLRVSNQYLSFLAGIFIFWTSSISNASDFGLQPTIEQAQMNQIIFEQAMSLVKDGKYKEGAELLADLYNITHSPRVKLEWARALYLGDDKRQAKTLFQDVLDTNPPYMVKEKIHVFLDDISKYDGKFSVSFGLVSDSNPKNLTTENTVNIFGQQYYYNPSVKAKTELGLSYSINANKALNEESPWYLGLSINGSKFNAVEYDKTSIEESISHKLFDTPRIYGKIAVEEYFFAGKLLYTYPSVSVKHTLETTTGYYFWDETKLGKLNYTDYTYLNGLMANLSSGFGKTISPQLNLGVEASLDRMNANESPYSFWTGTVGLVANFFVPDWELKTQIKAIKSYKKFDAMDPIFGETRKDDRSGVFVTVLKPNWVIQGMSPSLEVGYESNDSNINLYSYSRLVTNLYFKKSF